VDGRHAMRCGLAHRAGCLHTPVEGVMGEDNLYFVLRPADSEDVDRRGNAILTTTDCVYVEPFLPGHRGGGRGDARCDAVSWERRRGGRSNIDHRDDGSDEHRGEER